MPYFVNPISSPDPQASINPGNDLAELIQREGVGRVCTDHSVDSLQRLAVELADEIASGKKRVCPLPGLVGKAIFASGSSETDCCGIGIPLKIQILSFRPIGGAARRAAR